jgi:hypothetical protein
MLSRKAYKLPSFKFRRLLLLLGYLMIVLSQIFHPRFMDMDLDPFITPDESISQIASFMQQVRVLNVNLVCQVG